MPNLAGGEGSKVLIAVIIPPQSTPALLEGSTKSRGGRACVQDFGVGGCEFVPFLKLCPFKARFGFSCLLLDLEDRSLAGVQG